MYDYVIIGSGLFGCVFANLAKRDKKKCLIIEKRNHPFGNCYTENIDSINVHKYGPHVFHTSNKKIWDYVNQFCNFNNYINRPKVNYKDNIYSFPINLFTLYQIYGVTTPLQAIKKLDEVKVKIDNPQNLEEWILSQVGEEIYYKFIYGYTKKQWNTEPKNLPSFIIKRLPIRFDFNDNYFNDIFQGIPIGGYTEMMSNMIEDTDLILNVDYFDKRDYWNSKAKKIIYTGPLDRYYDYIHGKLNYRSLRFETEKLDIDSYQGNAIVNYTDEQVPYTRIIEHKYFENANVTNTIISKEYPTNYTENTEPYYPINDDHNNDIYNKYKALNTSSKILFGGRLAEYKYFDMHQVIGSAIHKYDTQNN